MVTTFTQETRCSSVYSVYKEGIMSYFKKLWSELLNLVFPPLQCCPFCGIASENGEICSFCRQEIVDFQQQPHCNRCGRRRTSKKLSFSSGKVLNTLDKLFSCADCLNQEKTFKMARAIGTYEGGLKEAIHKFKFKRQRYLAQLLGPLLVNVFWTCPAYQKVQVVVPVPLTLRRLRKRGFNQAELLAREVARALNLPLFLTLVKARETTPQTGLKREQRMDNLKGAFKVERPFLVANKTVLLIDDVFTTGATIEECSRTLTSAGAKEVYVLTVATGNSYG